MFRDAEPNRVDDAKRFRARLGLVALAEAFLLCLLVAVTKDPNPPFVPPPGATSDLDLFRQVVTRVHGGESFHDATHEELLKHDYPSRSVFNYRTPIYAWFLASDVGMKWGHALLFAAVITAVVLTCRDLLEDFGLIPAAASGLALVGATAWCLGGETYLFMELWAATLMLLSLCASRRGCPAVAVATGILALFYRELALPFCLVALGVAIWNGRRRESIGWAVGLLLFVAFMAWHAYQVQVRLTDADQAIQGGWIRFGGIRFILSTAQTNVFLMAMPFWLTALFLPFAIAGLFAGRGETGIRVGVTTALYLVAFSIVGCPFNFYWGFIYSPLLAISFAGAPRAIGWLVENAFTASEIEAKTVSMPHTPMRKIQSMSSLHTLN